MVPSDALHMTAVLEAFVTVAENDVVASAKIEVDVGDILTVIRPGVDEVDE